ncbi:hypothetical protein OBBRIDRAFT_729945 [Obba rivulosa]|uniref:RING-CH-type domain-containing protein n=1 Tax=Obba rivulosa TaxID=1052685 RepID=A0A8E2B272_9APHY|nr:hypothetical protein OBBRIDRAFT_729945 [Obba rivulosa]
MQRWHPYQYLRPLTRDSDAPDAAHDPAADAWVPTIDDLRVKLCYICREEESAEGPQVPRHVWVHPCRCSLVAHETCLLQWIRAAEQDTSRAANAMKCPQCGVEYELESDNPLVLRIMDSVNGGLMTVGRAVFWAGGGALIISSLFGVYIGCTAYGSYAVQEFLGKEMFSLLLSEDTAQWPWHAYFHLPAIPISLILARAGVHTNFPVATLLLAWTFSPPVSHPMRDMLTSHLRLIQTDTPAPQSEQLVPLFSWPPVPAAVTVLYPLLTKGYRLSFNRLRHWVLGTRPEPKAAVRNYIYDFNDNAPIRVRINHAIIPPPRAGAPPGQPAQAPQPQANPAPEPDAEDEEDAPAEGARTTRLTNAQIGRFVGGALMIPAIASFMGRILFRLARHSPFLRRFLAIRPPLGARHYRPPGGLIDPAQWRDAGLLKQMGLGLRLGVNLACCGTRVWADADPVWWRNSVGLGIFIVIKDCLKLVHEYLSRREQQTRRIKSRSFAGVEIKELDLIHPPTHIAI